MFSPQLTQKISANVFYQIIGKILSTILGLIAIAMITRYLGQEGFGEYSIIMAFLQIFGILTDFGLSLSGNQMISEPNADEKKIMGNIFSLRVASAVIFLGLAPLSVAFFPYSPLVKIGVALTTLSFFFISLQQIFTSVFQKYLSTHKVAISENISRVSLIIGIFTAIYYQMGLLGILTAIIISNLIHAGILKRLACQHIPFTFEIDWQVWKKIFKKSWPIAINITFNLIYLRADILLLSLFKNSGEVGLYGASYKVLEVLTTFPYLFSGLMLPILTFYWKSDNRESFKEAFQKSSNVMTILTLPMVAGTLLVATPFMTFIAGSDFKESGRILQILILATALIFLNNVASHVIVAIDKQKEMIKYFLTTAVISTIIYLIIIPKYGTYGAAWGTTIAQLLILIFTHLVLYKNIKFLPNLKIWPVSIFASAVMGSFLYIFIYIFNHQFNALMLGFEILISIVLYFAVLKWFKVISKEDIKGLIKI